MSNTPDILNIQQVHTTICWAACIEMIARWITPEEAKNISLNNTVPLQKEILKSFYQVRPRAIGEAPLNASELGMLANFCITKDNYPRIPDNLPYFTTIFNNLFKISCYETTISGLPQFQFVKEKIASKNSFILRLRYPGLLGNVPHAVVATKTESRYNLNLLKVNDPFASFQSKNICAFSEDTSGLHKGVTAYLNYAELSYMNSTNFIPGFVNSVSIVFNFVKAPLSIDSPDTIPLETSQPIGYKSIDEIVTLVKNLFENEVVYKDQYTVQRKNFTRQVIQTFFPSLQYFLAKRLGNEIALIPILYGGEQQFDTLISFDSHAENPYHFIGIRESYFPTLRQIKADQLKGADPRLQDYRIDHSEPNYFLVHLQQVDFRFIVLKKSLDLYISLTHFPDVGLKYLSVYSYDEIRTILFKNFPLTTDSN